MEQKFSFLRKVEVGGKSDKKSDRKEGVQPEN